jgi:hypothetical protein
MDSAASRTVFGGRPSYPHGRDERIPLGIAGSWYPTPGHLAGCRGAVTPKTLGPLPSSATGDDESHGSLTPSDRFHRRRPVGGSATSGVWWAVERPALDARAHDRACSGRSWVVSEPRCCCRPCSRSSTGTSTARRGGRSTPSSARRWRSRDGRAAAGRVQHHVSWRLGFALEVVIIAVVLSGIRLVRDVPYEGDRGDAVGVLLSVAGMGGVVLGVLV